MFLSSSEFGLVLQYYHVQDLFSANRRPSTRITMAGRSKIVF
jgi:hypothetical protein